MPQKQQAVASTLAGLGISMEQGAELAGPPEEDAPAEAVLVDRVKMFFTKNGFEVHAPLGLTFSIGGPVSRFAVFGNKIVVDQDTFPASVVIEGGGTELSLDTLPPDIRPVIESVHFPPSMDFPG